MSRKIRVLVGKPGLDGHDRGAKVVAAALRDAGMEVIYTGLHQTPEQIVEAAVQEDVDVVALSILSGAHMTLFPGVLRLMKSRGIGDRLLTGGGIIPPEDMESLARTGVGRLFGPGSSTQDIAVYIREWFAARREGGERPPVPAVKSQPRRTPAARIATRGSAVKPAPQAPRRAKSARVKATPGRPSHRKPTARKTAARKGASRKPTARKTTVTKAARRK